MAVQIIEEGARNVIVKIDGASGVVYDASTLLPPFTRLNINKIWSSLPVGTQVELFWDATTDVSAFVIHETPSYLDFDFFGGLRNNAGAGVTGSINYTVTGTGDWVVILHLTKH